MSDTDNLAKEDKCERSILSLAQAYCQPPEAAPHGERAQLSVGLSELLLVSSIANLRLPVPERSHVAMLVPNGSGLAVALLAVMDRYTAVPLADSEPVRGNLDKLELFAATCLLVPEGPAGLALREAVEAHPTLAHQVKCFTVTILDNGALQLELDAAAPAPASELAPAGPAVSRGGQITLLLGTSGTTGKPKVVPFTHSRMLSGAHLIADTLELGRRDVGANMMPLHHIGGIMVSLFGVLVSAGSMHFLPRFDPSSWFALVAHAAYPITWTHLAPRMWSYILSFAQGQGLLDEVVDGGPASEGAVFRSSHRIRLVRSGAAKLPHRMALQLRQLLGEHVAMIPSYSMSEAMPIASCDTGYQLQHPGTVGRPQIPLVIMDGQGTPVPTGETGEVTLMGKGQNQLFSGYLVKSAESTPAGTPPAMVVKPFEGDAFPTGDLGYLDADGYLYLVGRKKEVINRGGELLTPAEVEEALALQPQLKGNVMAFAAPHEELEEVVGLAVLHDALVGLDSLRTWAMAKLAPAKLPQVLVFAPTLPRTSTGKLQRSGYAKKIKMPTLRDSDMPSFWLSYDQATQEPLLSEEPPQAESEALLVSTLKSCIGVLDAKVVTLELPHRRVALVTPSMSNGSDLMHGLIASIPKHFLPDVVIAVDSLDVGEDALQERVEAEMAKGEGAVMAHEQMSEMLLRVMGAIKDLPEVSKTYLSPDDSIVELGVTSVGIAQLVVGLQDVGLTVASLYELLTPRRIADWAEAHTTVQAVQTRAERRDSLINSFVKFTKLFGNVETSVSVFNKSNSNSFKAKELTLDQILDTLPDHSLEEECPLLPDLSLTMTGRLLGIPAVVRHLVGPLVKKSVYYLVMERYIQFEDTVDVDLLTRSIALVMRAYPILRGRLRSTAGTNKIMHFLFGEVMQEMSLRPASEPPPLEVIETNRDLPAYIKRVYDRLASQTNFAHSMVHFGFIKATNRLHITLDHMLGDGTTMSLISNAVVRAYRGNPLVPEGLTVNDFVRHQNSLPPMDIHEVTARYHDIFASTVELQERQISLSRRSLSCSKRIMSLKETRLMKHDHHRERKQPLEWVDSFMGLDPGVKNWKRKKGSRRMQCKFQTVLGALPQGISPRCAFFTCFAMAMEETNGIHTMVVSEVLDTRATYGDGRYNSTMGNLATNVKTILSINPFLSIEENMHLLNASLAAQQERRTESELIGRHTFNVLEDVRWRCNIITKLKQSSMEELGVIITEKHHPGEQGPQMVVDRSVDLHMEFSHDSVWYKFTYDRNYFTTSQMHEFGERISDLFIQYTAIQRAKAKVQKMEGA